MRTPYLAALAALAGLFALAGAAHAQEELPPGFQRCGDPNLVLVFMNPDLKPADDGFVHASGSFFIQFQARGERALDVDSFKFSFGKDSSGVISCDTPEWVTGAYLKNYRADYEPDDGFHVNINTCNVPDGDYAAAISAYDAQLNEIARYYTKARVVNGEGNNAAERCMNPDTTAPWPIILPGDGVRLDGGQGLYVEVAEPVSSVEAFINGKRLELAQGEGPERDDDLVPDLGYNPAIRDAGLAQGHHTKVRYPVFTWDGVLTDGDVIRVRVTDQWGNVADKVVHLGDPTIGGRVTGAKPVFKLEIPVTTADSDANGTGVYNVSYITESPEGLHADLHIEGKDGAALPDGITYRLKPDHVMMGGNAKLDGTITLIATPEVATGTYQVVFVADYLTGSGREQKHVTLTFNVREKPTTDASQQDEVADKNQAIEQQDVRGEKIDAQQAAEEAPPEEEKGLPMPSPLLAALLVGALALARRRLR